MTEQLSITRRRRLLDRANRTWESNPQLCLDSVEQLLLDGVKTPDLLLLKARALGRLLRSSEAGALWAELLDLSAYDTELALEALHFYLGCFDYAAIKGLLTRLEGELPAREDALILCIRAAQAVRQSALALDLCQRLVELAPENAVHRSKLGSLYQSYGRMEEAERAFERALSIDPDFQPGWYFLAQLRKWDSGADHIRELKDFLQRYEATGNDTSAIHYALAKELEDLEQFSDAYHHLQAGAGQVRKRSAYGSDQDRKLFCELRSWYSQSGSGSIEGHREEGPVFILGMPRTGSTLTDRILSSHDEVESVGELMCFKRALEEVCGGQGQPDFFASFFGQAPTQLPYGEIGRRYLEMLSPLTGEEHYFIDKMPMNYAFVGVIARALPEARFVHTVRNPMDTCFSNYKQMFGEGYYGYSYDFDDLAAHYKLYRELMVFWHEQLPGKIYDVHYEQLVDDPEAEVRKLLDWLGLSWQSGCLDFHQRGTAVNTASVSQVRQPIYRGSVEKWRKFGDHLKPLRMALEVSYD